MNDDSEILHYSKKPYYIIDGEYIDANKTVFLNISEDMFGCDVYEFKYEGKVYSSRVVLR